MLKENLKVIEERIQAACLRSGRKREDVTLIAVSKTKPVEMIREIMDCKVVDFGENKVQEVLDKQEAIKEKLNWHFIGHLQRNKVKYIVDRVCLVHSVDSVRLAGQIETEAAKRNIICPVLIEVNISGEESKFGVSPQETEEIIRTISKFPHVKQKGLMTIAPFVEEPEENRKYFKNMKKLMIDIKTKNIDNVDMDILSMGMTGDFEIAIEEGSTMVRVGTGIFGERNYNISET